LVVLATCRACCFGRRADSFEKSTYGSRSDDGSRVALEEGMRGFSLVEVLVATAILTAGVAGLAQLVALASRTTLHAKEITFAAVLAQEKVERLLADVVTAAATSPPGALESNVDGYVDFADAAGRLLGSGPTAPAGSAYVRRWSIDREPTGGRNTWVVQVLVADLRSRSVARFTAARTEDGF
jgi:prepilin-type N-terminal cleavage/methylation domain-containing protein